MKCEMWKCTLDDDNVHNCIVNLMIKVSVFLTPRLGRGRATISGNISGYWVWWEHLMSQLCWQHDKIISPNKNSPSPPEQSTTIAWILGLQLSRILCLGLVHTKLMRLGFLNFIPGQSYARLNMDRGKLRALPGLGDGHRFCPKSAFLARIIRVQSIDTKGYFWAIFYKTASLFWFSLFLLPL